MAGSATRQAGTHPIALDKRIVTNPGKAFSRFFHQPGPFPLSYPPMRLISTFLSPAVASLRSSE